MNYIAALNSINSLQCVGGPVTFNWKEKRKGDTVVYTRKIRPPNTEALLWRFRSSLARRVTVCWCFAGRLTECVTTYFISRTYFCLITPCVVEFIQKRINFLRFRSDRNQSMWSALVTEHIWSRKWIFLKNRIVWLAMPCEVLTDCR